MAPVATAAYMATGGLPANASLAIAIGLFEVSAALALLLGYKARWVAFVLAAYTLLASLLFHNFWAVPAEQQYVQQLLLLKNIGIVGGLLFVAAMGSGVWSVDSLGTDESARRPGAVAG